MNIPDKAVEAAARATYESKTGRDGFNTSNHRGAWLKIARDTLEAAAPFIAAQAWDQGYDVGRNDGWHDARDHTPNPYRA